MRQRVRPSLLTVSDLEQGFSDDTTSDVQGLAAIVSHVWSFSIGDCKVPRLGYRQSAEGLGRLWWEEQVLSGGQNNFLLKLGTSISSSSEFDLRSTWNKKKTQNFTALRFVYLTAFPLPENGWLWVSSGLTLEGNSPANSNHLVPRSHHKCWGHWRTAMRMVSQQRDKQHGGYYQSYYNITVTCGPIHLKGAR